MHTFKKITALINQPEITDCQVIFFFFINM